jgi:hypothetical protein
MKYKAAFARTVATVTLRGFGLHLGVGLPTGREGFFLYRSSLSRIPLMTNSYEKFLFNVIANFEEKAYKKPHPVSFVNPGFNQAFRETVDSLI